MRRSLMPVIFSSESEVMPSRRRRHPRRSMTSLDVTTAGKTTQQGRHGVHAGHMAVVFLSESGCDAIPGAPCFP
jgi:hypothetical protein